MVPKQCLENPQKEKKIKLNINEIKMKGKCSSYQNGINKRRVKWKGWHSPKMKDVE